MKKLAAIVTALLGLSISGNSQSLKPAVIEDTAMFNSLPKISIPKHAMGFTLDDLRDIATRREQMMREGVPMVKLNMVIMDPDLTYDELSVKLDSMEQHYKDLGAFSELEDLLIDKYCHDSTFVESIFDHDSLAIDDSVVSWMNKAPSGKLTYERYREIIKIWELKDQAKDFFEEHKKDLLEAQLITGVDYRVLLGIAGVETRFGKILGEHNWVNVFATRYARGGWNTKKNAAFQLSEVLRWSEKKNMTIDELMEQKSSIAGAYGLTQFMPSSLNTLYVGEDGMIHTSDPFSWSDAFFSSANYLANNYASFNGRRYNGNWDPRYNHSLPEDPWDPNYYSIFSYNRWDIYVKAVVEIANSEGLRHFTEGEIKEELSQMEMAQFYKSMSKRMNLHVTVPDATLVAPQGYRPIPSIVPVD